MTFSGERRDINDTHTLGKFEIRVYGEAYGLYLYEYSKTNTKMKIIHL